ncbi:hypothetical protein PR048_027864 [Dryococelus australis]|uniref:Tesmin/TSO1-like CXC domain-containing protein n=1 Tax=Dryococelus australis TaxID=614101 RepID=A0ABQ9GHR3_9NEOP|nr:hypothetical protein PR048_027864 [Dryococelus australis]
MERLAYGVAGELLPQERRRNNTGQRNIRFSACMMDQHNDGLFFHCYRDYRDICSYNPFGRSDEHLLSISGGFIADNSINCDSAHEVGIAAIDRMTRNNQTYADLQLKRKDKKVQINSNQLFRRIICQMPCGAKQIDLESCLCSELTTLTPSLFDDHSLRNPGSKSRLIPLKERKATPTDEIPSYSTFVIDGGDFLNRVIWPNAYTHKGVCNSYHACLEHAEQGSLQEQLLSLWRLNEAGHHARQAAADADTDAIVIQTATEETKNRENVVAVGEYTDLLVLLIELVPPSLNLYFMIPKTKFASRKVFRVIQTNLCYIKNYVLFVHVMSGCDSTSAPYRVGKVKSFKKIEYSNIRKLVDPFNATGISQDEAAAAEPLIVSLQTNCFICLFFPRLQQLQENKVFRCMYKCSYGEASLFLQVSGVVNGEHTPVPTLQVAAPEIIMKQISCNCISYCERPCSCRRAGLKCSPMCGRCAGDGCANLAEVVDDSGEQTHSLLDE